MDKSGLYNLLRLIMALMVLDYILRIPKTCFGRVTEIVPGCAAAKHFCAK